jgi:Fe2+ or Zn2+ uptake regulation protein
MEHKRKTIQQQVILGAVRELNIHATAEEVYEYVSKKHPSISRATVYRNLGQMSESGELVNIGSFYGSTHYDHNCRRHYHFICEQCKRVFDVQDYFSELTGQITGMDGFEITGHQLTFSGLCSDCKNQNDL